MTMKEHVAKSLLGTPTASKWWLIMLFVATIALTWPIVSVANAVTDWQPPIAYIEAYAPKPDVAAGGQVEVRFDVDRTRICPIMTISRAIVDQSGTEHVVQGYTRAPETRPGREVYDRLITVPETVPPGKAWYYLRIKYGCNFLNFLGWQNMVVESPRVLLNVLPKVDLGADPGRQARAVVYYDG